MMQKVARVKHMHLLEVVISKDHCFQKMDISAHLVLLGLFTSKGFLSHLPASNQGVSVVVDVPNPTKNIRVGQMLKCSLSSCLSFEKQNVLKKEYLNVNSEVGLDLEQPEDVVIKDSRDQKMQGAVSPWRSFLALPGVHDARCSQLILLGSLGRVLPSDLQVQIASLS